MITSAEKITKLLVKTLAKKNNLDYSKLKEQSKKIVKFAKEYDEKLYGIMEELMDLQKIDNESELKDFDPQTLMIFCRIKDIDITDMSDKNVRKAVWEVLEEENDEDYDDSGESDSDDGSNVEVELEDSDSDESEKEESKVTEIEEPIKESVKEKKSKKKVTVVE